MVGSEDLDVLKIKEELSLELKKSRFSQFSTIESSYFRGTIDFPVDIKIIEDLAI